MMEINKATMQDKMRNLRDAVDKYDDEKGRWGWMKDADESYVYVEYGSECYRIPYTMTEQGLVTLGETKERVVQESTFSVVEEPEDSLVAKILKGIESVIGSRPGIRVTKSDALVIKQFDEDEMVAIEPMYIAPFDTTGEIDGHDDAIDEAEIRKMVDNFNINLEKGNIKSNIDHTEETDKFSVLKAWVNECDCYIGESFVPEGQPIVKTKFHDKELWEQRKSGELMGVSIGAKATACEFVEVEVENG